MVKKKKQRSKKKTTQISVSCLPVDRGIWGSGARRSGDQDIRVYRFKLFEHFTMSDSLFILALLNDRQIMNILTSASRDRRQFRRRIGHKNLPETDYQTFLKASILLI